MNAINKLNSTILFILVLTTMVGCNPKKSNRSNPGRAARAGANTPFNNGTNNNQMGTNANGAGSEFGLIRSSNSYSIQQSVQGLVSATMNPQELGVVRDNSDVAIIGYVDMDQNGNITNSNSRLRLEIWDEYARSGVSSEIAFAFNTMANASFNGNIITMVFSDEYGDIIISGDVSQWDFIGTVSYQNRKSFDGNSNPASGTLGTFQLPFCSFFRCQ